METSRRDQSINSKIEYLEEQIAILKDTQMALKRERDFTSQVLHWIDSLVVVIDLKGRVASFNKASEQLSGYRFEDFGDTPFWETLIPPEEREGVSATISGVINKGLPGSFQNHWITKDKQKRLISWTNTTLLKPDGAIEYILCTGMDISERTQAEKALRESETKYRELVQSANSVIIRLDKKGNFTFINQFAESFFGYNKEELLGKNSVGTIIPETDMNGNKELSLINDIVENPERYTNYENENICKDGQRVWVTWTNKVFYNKDGKVSEILCIGNDNTARNELEKKLRQAQKMESIGTLAGGIAHDFNNILVPVIGHTEMLLDDLPEKSPFRISLNEVLKGALRAKDLVGQILAFSRQTTQEIRPLKIQKILKEVLNLIRSTLPSTIQIRPDIDPLCGMIMADPTQIHQIMMNLATNAYHAMEKTGGTLSIGLKEVHLTHDNMPRLNMDPGPYVCLTIADTGTGMDTLTKEKIFDPYFTTKEKGKGTGLGLAVVHGIVESYHGTSMVQSKLGKGTLFTIYIPMLVSNTETITRVQPSAVLTGHERILLVDDEEPIATLTQSMLERLGYQVTVRISSIDTLEAFKAGPDKFDLVITDMTMPNMTGDELAIEIKKIRFDIPIILSTGFSEKIGRGGSSLPGIDSVLMKPLSMNELAMIVRSVLDKKIS
jgi:PAS domain S-box-containing protein